MRMKKLISLITITILSAAMLFSAEITLPTGEKIRGSIIKKTADGTILEVRLVHKTDVSTPLGIFPATGKLVYYPCGVLESFKFNEPTAVQIGKNKINISQAVFSEEGTVIKAEIKEDTPIETPYGTVTASQMQNIDFYGNGNIKSLLLAKQSQITIDSERVVAFSKSELKFHENGKIAYISLRSPAKLNTVFGKIKCKEKSEVFFDEQEIAYEFSLGTIYKCQIEGNEVILDGFAPIKMNANNVPRIFRTYKNEFRIGRFNLKLDANEDVSMLVRCYDDGSYAFVTFAGDCETRISLTVNDSSKKISVNGFFITPDKQKLCAWKKTESSQKSDLYIFNAAQDGTTGCKEYKERFYDYYQYLRKHYNEIFEQAPFKVSSDGAITSYVSAFKSSKPSYTDFVE